MSKDKRGIIVFCLYSFLFYLIVLPYSHISLKLVAPQNTRLKKLVFIVLLACINRSYAQTTALGYQLGYNYSPASMIDAGFNLYHATQAVRNHCHTFGPSASITGIFVKNVFYIGHRYGFNYHLTHNVTAYRINAAYEHNGKKDQRVGADLGVSCLGVFLYGGYYFPIGSFENPGISRFRIGIRLIFNLAPAEEVWHM